MSRSLLSVTRSDVRLSAKAAFDVFEGSCCLILSGLIIIVDFNVLPADAGIPYLGWEIDIDKRSLAKVHVR